MFFHSLSYALVFLPVAVTVYFLLNRTGNAVLGKVWLVCASLFFYGFTNYAFIPVIIVSISINYIFGRLLAQDAGIAVQQVRLRKLVLLGGVLFNLGALMFYKYTNFVIDTLNDLFIVNITPLGILLPLGISFLAFQQIAYLVDCYNREVREGNFLNYCLFITFFPRLIAGPLVYHHEVMPQFASPQGRKLNYDNLSRGLIMISVGLFKKIVIADALASCADRGFDIASRLSFFDAWLTSLSYTLQIYFDFSGYTDIALGSAFLFNIALPINFNSPYRSLDMQEFWRRWHITLSRWLIKYLYIPLGGNRRGTIRTFLNILITFIVCGIWHGAGWTFLAWGGMHGLGIIACRIWRNAGVRLPKAVSWLLTFLYVNCAWVLFRAETFGDAMKVYRGMVDIGSIALPGTWEKILSLFNDTTATFSTWIDVVWTGGNSFLCVVLGMILSIAFKNSQELMNTFNLRWALLTSIMALWALMLLSKESEFVYFQF